MKLFSWLFLFCLFHCPLLAHSAEVFDGELENQIQLLKNSQTTQGAFYPQNCLNKKMSIRCKSDRSLFFTALIAESLGGISHPQAKLIREQAVSYLTDQYTSQEGRLRYFEKDFPLYKIVKPDMDDNSMVYALMLEEPSRIDPDELNLNFQKLFNEGLITTTLKDKSKKHPAIKDAQYFTTWIKPTKPFFDDIDLVVNANSLFGFAAYNKTAKHPLDLSPVCKSVNEVISWSEQNDFHDLTSDRNWTLRKKTNYSQWYPSKYAVMFSLVRAHQTMGEKSCLTSSYQKIRKHLLSQSSFGANIYDQALATAALSRVAVLEQLQIPSLEKNIKLLIENLQNKKLGKDPFYFFNIGYTGSIDLVRALLIEALHNFQQVKGRHPASTTLQEMDFLNNLLSEQMEDGSFTALIKPSSPLYNIFVVFLYEYMGVTEEKKEISHKLVQHIFSQQKENGALAGYPEGPDHAGISTAGYVAAKIAGISEDDPRMLKLERKIHEMGGAQKPDMLTTPFMMMFSLFPLHSTFNTNIDRLVLKLSPHLPWVKVLMHPILYLLDNGHNKVLSQDKYPSRIFKASYAKYKKKKGTPKAQKDDLFIKWSLENMNPDGTFFDYTPTTVPMLMALSTFPEHQELVARGIKTIESFQEVTPEGFLLQTPGEASVGETFYVANVLLDVGIPHTHPAILKAEKYLLDHQLATGGWGFSKNSIHFADSDDTSNSMYFLIRLDHARGKKIRDEVFKALDWLLTLQNKDGGFGTWERTKGGPIGNLINRVANRKGLVMSESVFEHTARIVVCLSYLKALRPEAKLAYHKAYKWLLKQQKKDGSFAGTWFINYMFSTSMALTALSTDLDKGEKAIAKGINYLISTQAADGGFGESPDSFLKSKAVALGYSSWSQTGLIVSQLHTMNNFSQCKYQDKLQALFDTTFLYLRDEKNGWTQSMDPTWTAVTFPKVEYLIYPYIQRLVPWQAYNMHLSSGCR